MRTIFTTLYLIAFSSLYYTNTIIVTYTLLLKSSSDMLFLSHPLSSLSTAFTSCIKIFSLSLSLTNYLLLFSYSFIIHLQSILLIPTLSLPPSLPSVPWGYCGARCATRLWVPVLDCTDLYCRGTTNSTHVLRGALD